MTFYVVFDRRYHFHKYRTVVSESVGMRKIKARNWIGLKVSNYSFKVIYEPPQPLGI
jgi:hypothetical protein